MNELYILDSDFKTPVMASDAGEWGRWHRLNDSACTVAQDSFSNLHNGKTYNVKTRFMGKELNLARVMNRSAPSHTFETVGFHLGAVIEQERCGGWAEAEVQHRAIVAKLQAATHARAKPMPEGEMVLQT
jgi:hypothetical protein